MRNKSTEKTTGWFSSYLNGHIIQPLFPPVTGYEVPKITNTIASFDFSSQPILY
jgi:hypothetical protein